MGRPALWRAGIVRPWPWCLPVFFGAGGPRGLANAGRVKAMQRTADPSLANVDIGGVCTPNQCTRSIPFKGEFGLAKRRNGNRPPGTWKLGDLALDGRGWGREAKNRGSGYRAGANAVGDADAAEGIAGDGEAWN